MALGLFRTMAALARDIIIANTFGSAALLIIFLLGGFILPKGKHHFHNKQLSVCFTLGDNLLFQR